MEGEAYPFPIKEVDRRVAEAVTRINVLEAGKQENASRIAVLESQRMDIKEDVDRLGDKLREEVAGVRTDVGNLRTEALAEIAKLRKEEEERRSAEEERRDERRKAEAADRKADRRMYVATAIATVTALLVALIGLAQAGVFS